MPKKRKISELEPEDFPGVDPIKFFRWRVTTTRDEPKALIAYGAIVVVGVLALAIFRPLRFLPTFIWGILAAAIVLAAALGAFLLITAKGRSLQKEAGLDTKSIQEARRREAPPSPAPPPRLEPVDREVPPAPAGHTAGSPRTSGAPIPVRREVLPPRPDETHQGG